MQADKKGDFYVALTEKQGRPAIEVIAEISRGDPNFPGRNRCAGVVDDDLARVGGGELLMRLGETGWLLRWVRPLHSIIATFGPETEEPDIVPFEIDGIKAGDETRGHRFMAPSAIKVRRFDDYVAKLTPPR